MRLIRLGDNAIRLIRLGDNIIRFIRLGSDVIRLGVKYWENLNCSVTIKKAVMLGVVLNSKGPIYGVFIDNLLIKC